MFETAFSIVRVRVAALIALVSLIALSPISSSATGSLTLAWDPSPDTSVVSYKLYYGSETGVYTNSVLAGNATTVTVSNLTEGATYYFACTAWDTNGLESDFSNEANGFVKIPNRPPTLNLLGNVSVNEDSAPFSVSLSGISSGDVSENQTLLLSATSSDPSIIPNPVISYTSPGSTGSLTFSPKPSAYGSATITVTVNDGETTNNLLTRSFIITVNPVNDLPTLNSLSNLSINQDSGSRTVNLSGISSGAANENQLLTVTVTSSNPSLIPNPTVHYTSPDSTGTLTFAPAASASGSATIAVMINDGGTSNNIVARSFTVTVLHVNAPPTISTIANVTTLVGVSTAPVSFTITDPETAASNLTLSGTSDNSALVPVGNIVFGGSNGSRTVTVMPAAGHSGIALITISVSDGVASASSSFQLTVNPKPVPPGNLRVSLQ